ncbi:MAG TPA: hypothetical protein DCS93_40595 [Microscillaceae bacterium]|nr:hypothetical protein [Microscillaceae bacterium]
MVIFPALKGRIRFMRVIPLFIFIVLSGSLGFAQNTVIDNLKMTLQEETSNIKKVDILNQLAKKLIQQDIDEGKKYALRALKLAQESNYAIGKAWAYLHLGTVWSQKGDIDQAREYFMKALSIFQVHNRPKQINKSFILIGNSYFRQSKREEAKKYWLKGLAISKKHKDSIAIGRAIGRLGLIYAELDSDRAIEQYKKALSLQKRLKDSKGLGYSYNNIGLEYYYKGDYDKALKAFEQALDIKEKTTDTLDITSTLNNLAMVYDSQGQEKQALKYYQQVLDYYRRIHSVSGIGDVLGNIGLVYLDMEEYEKAIQSFNDSYIIQKKKNKIDFAASALYNTGLVYEAQKKYSLAFQKFKEALKMGRAIQDQRLNAKILAEMGNVLTVRRQYKEAYDTLQVALKISQQLKAKDLLRHSYERLAELDSTQGNFKRGWEFYKKYVAIQDSLFNEAKNKQLVEIQTRYETKKKEQEITIKNKKIALLRKEKEHEKLLKYTFVSSLISLIMIGGLVIILLRLRVRKNKQLLIQNRQIYEAEKKLTQATLNEKKLQAEALQKEVELKQQQLTSQALHIVQKNEMIEKIRYHVALTQKSRDIKNLQQLSRLVDSSLSLDRDWDSFFSLFSEIHQGFFTKLKHKSAKLSDSELRLCALIRLKFTSKEIATILGIIHGSTSVARHRIRKKLLLPKEDKLSDFIASL